MVDWDLVAASAGGPMDTATEAAATVGRGVVSGQVYRRGRLLFGTAFGVCGSQGGVSAPPRVQTRAVERRQAFVFHLMQVMCLQGWSPWAYIQYPSKYGTLRPRVAALRCLVEQDRSGWNCSTPLLYFWLSSEFDWRQNGRLTRTIECP